MYNVIFCFNVVFLCLHNSFDIHTLTLKFRHSQAIPCEAKRKFTLNVGPCRHTQGALYNQVEDAERPISGLAALVRVND